MVVYLVDEIKVYLVDEIKVFDVGIICKNPMYRSGVSTESL